jgi:hypothetical protein
VSDHFATLGLTNKATAEEVKARYHALAKEWNPSRPDAPPNANRRMQEVNDAYPKAKEEAELRASGRWFEPVVLPAWVWPPPTASTPAAQQPPKAVLFTDLADRLTRPGSSQHENRAAWMVAAILVDAIRIFG